MEQGSRVAYILVHRNSAYDARAIEAAISATDGISEVVHSKTKRALLAMAFDPNVALSRLRELGESFANRLSLPMLGECIDFTQNYLGGGSLEPSIADLTAVSPLRISGRGIGIIGTVLIVATESRQYMASLSDTLGYVINVFNRIEPNPCAPGQAQMRLF